MPTSRAQVVEQLRKLQTLAKRAAGTPEAAVARRKMRELMQRHGISIADLRPTSAPHVHHEVAPAPTSRPVKITIDLGGFRIRWKL